MSVPRRWYSLASKWKEITKNKSTRLDCYSNFWNPVIVLQVDDNHTYLFKQNGRVSMEFDSRLKACFTSTSGAGKASRTDEPNPQPTRPGMVVGWKRRWPEKADMRNMLEDRTEFQRQWQSTVRVDYKDEAAETGTPPKTEEDNVLTQLEMAPLTRSVWPEGEW